MTGLRRRIAAAILIALPVIGIGIVAQRATAAPAEPWPGFTMVYQDTRTDLATGTAIVQEFRLTYTDTRHFTNTLVSHSAVPEAAGWSNTMNGATSNTTDPRLGVVSQATWTPEQRGLPADWLRPSVRPWLASRPGATVTGLPGGLAQVILSYMLDGRQDVEELTYRAVDGIPTQYIERVDGKEVRHVEVLELTVP